MVDDRKSLLVGRLESMLALQDSINSKINSTWRTAGNPWYRAIWTECAELMDHVGWKWWKQQEVDMLQVHLELVDIFHFGLSELLQAHGSPQSAASYSIAAYDNYAAGRSIEPNADRWLSLIEEFALKVLNTKAFDLRAFSRLATAFGLDELTLYEKYVEKNVLNIFRQDHGYKTGVYQKVWFGREDNEWLSAIAATIPKSAATFPQELYRQLAQKYSEVPVGG